MVKNLKRWGAMNKVYLLIIGLIAFFGYMDSRQILAFHELNSDVAWNLYGLYTGPAIFASWIVFILLIGVIYYFMTKDKSESIGLASAGLIMLMTGLEDVFFFIFSKTTPTDCMQWFNDVGAPNSYWSTYILGETCVSPLAMYSFAAIGLIVAYKVYKYLQVKK